MAAVFLGLIALAAVVMIVLFALAIVFIVLEIALRLLMAFGIAIAVGAAIIAAEIMLGWPDGTGVIAGLVSFPLAIMIVWQLRGPVGKRLEDRQPEKFKVKPSSQKVGPPETIAPISQAEPAGDEEVGKAWMMATNLEPHYAEELNQARAFCGELLHRTAAANMFEPAILDHAALIRRHVPGLLDDLRLAQGLEAEEVTAARSIIVKRLIEIGNKSSVLMERERERLRQALSVRQIHLSRALSDGAPELERET